MHYLYVDVKLTKSLRFFGAHALLIIQFMVSKASVQINIKLLVRLTSTLSFAFKSKPIFLIEFWRSSAVRGFFVENVLRVMGLFFRK